MISDTYGIVDMKATYVWRPLCKNDETIIYRVNI